MADKLIEDVENGVEEWLDNLDPDDQSVRVIDGLHTRPIVAAREAVEAAEAQLRSVVAAARAAGVTWAVIGASLGTTRQNAYQRFGR